MYKTQDKRTSNDIRNSIYKKIQGHENCIKWFIKLIKKIIIWLFLKNYIFKRFWKSLFTLKKINQENVSTYLKKWFDLFLLKEKKL